MIKKLYYKYRLANPKKADVNRFTRSKFGNFAIMVLIVAAGLFSMLPLVYAVVTSFKPIDELLIFPPTFFVRRPTTVNYVALPTLLSSLSVPLSRYIFNSFSITIVTSVLNILFSAMAAFSLSKGKYKFRGVFFMLVQFALMFNSYTLAVPQYFIFSKLKIVDTYWVYVLPQLAGTLGVFLIKQYIEGYVPDALMEAAKIDGASYPRIFWQIIMPIIKPAWLTVVLFAFPTIWGAIPNGTIFNEELKTLPQIVTQITAGGTARAGSAMAITTIMMIPPIIVYLISQSNVVEAMSSAGIKDM